MLWVWPFTPVMGSFTAWINKIDIWLLLWGFLFPCLNLCCFLCPPLLWGGGWVMRLTVQNTTCKIRYSCNPSQGGSRGSLYKIQHARSDTPVIPHRVGHEVHCTKYKCKIRYSCNPSQGGSQGSLYKIQHARSGTPVIPHRVGHKVHYTYKIQQAE